MDWRLPLLVVLVSMAFTGPVTAVLDSGLLAEPPLRILSFNIRVFGLTKMKNSLVVRSVLKILKDYDISTIQEIRDSSESAFPKLVQLLNESTDEGKYAYTVSKRLGRTSSKEQYGVIYRADRVELVDTYQYEDGADDGTDAFEREPFAVLFRVSDSEIEEFSLISVHTKPAAAAAEVDKLTQVYDAVATHWNNPNSIIAGDFNSDCDLVRSDDWPNITLWTDKRFLWVIGKCNDTTVTRTDCAYDRFVVAGEQLKAAVIHKSGQVVRFDESQGLTVEEALQVSDHYPIEMLIAGKVIRGVQTRLRSHIGFTISEVDYASVEAMLNLGSNSPESNGFDIEMTVNRAGRQHSVIAQKDRITNVVSYLELFQKAFPDIVSTNVNRAVISYLEAECIKTAPYVYGLKETTGKTFELVITCTFSDRQCRVGVNRRTS